MYLQEKMGDQFAETVSDRKLEQAVDVVCTFVMPLHHVSIGESKLFSGI